MNEVDARSELFLTCDLVDSTALKQSRGTGWAQVFLGFYIDFPVLLGEVGKDRGVDFRLWKPIGDELVFRVRLKEEADVSRAVRAWLATLDRYEQDTATKHGRRMRTKGGAFVGTFPGPDVEASVARDPREEVSSVISPPDINDERLNARNDANYIYDFFGPGFDTGFRVIGQATPRHFTMTVEVALCMCRAAQNQPLGMDGLTDLTYLGPRELKGVWDGRDYPLFAIDRHAGDDINKAMKAAAQQTPGTQQSHISLLETCVTSDELPTKIYLPDSKMDALTHYPEDALQAMRGEARSTEGLEEAPDALNATDGEQVDDDRLRLPEPPDGPRAQIY